MARLRESAEMVALNAEHVKINKRKLYRLVDIMIEEIRSDSLKVSRYLHSNLWPNQNNPRFHGRFPYTIADWLFVVNLLSFGFSKEPYDLAWTKGRYRGYYGICYAVNTALEKGTDIVNPRCYTRIPNKELKRMLFSSDNNIPIPRLYKRLEALKESGRVLIREYHGTFENCILQARGSALRLLEIITRKFSFFYDRQTFKDTYVDFHTKAQRLIVNVWSYYKNKGLGEFRDMHLLTAASCHRIPQLFTYYDIFDYSVPLVYKILNNEFLISGSRMDVEIRGCTIYAIELMKDKFQNELFDDIDNPLYVNQLLSYKWKEEASEMYGNGYFPHLTSSVHY